MGEIPGFQPEAQKSEQFSESLALRMLEAIKEAYKEDLVKNTVDDVLLESAYNGALSGDMGSLEVLYIKEFGVEALEQLQQEFTEEPEVSAEILTNDEVPEVSIEESDTTAVEVEKTEELEENEDSDVEKKEDVESSKEYDDIHAGLLFLKNNVDSFFEFTDRGTLKNSDVLAQLKALKEGFDEKNLVVILIEKCLEIFEALGALIKDDDISIDSVDNIFDTTRTLWETKINEALQYTSDIVSEDPQIDITEGKKAIATSIKDLISQFDVQIASTMTLQIENDVVNDDSEEEEIAADEEVANDDVEEVEESSVEESEQSVLVDDVEYDIPAPDEIPEDYEYPYAFKKEVLEKNVFITNDADLVKDWKSMGDAGLFKGNITQESDGSTKLIVKEKIVPWVGHLKMKQFMDLNLVHFAKDRNSLKNLKTHDGVTLPEVVFLDKVAFDAFQATNGDMSHWFRFMESPYGKMLQSKYGIETGDIPIEEAQAA